MELDILVRSINTAKKPEDVFGVIPDGTPQDRVSVMKRIFHSIVLVVHPDRNLGATGLGDVVTKLVAFKSEAEKVLLDGTYGASRKAKVTATMTSKRGTYKVVEEFRTGDVADLFVGEFDGTRCLLKLTRAPGDSDLLDIEARTLMELHQKPHKHASIFRKYLPVLAESFVVIEGGKHRRVNVLDEAEGCYSLAEIKNAYPEGLDPRDMAWMIRRAFEGIGYVHELGYVHGALVPEHILVHPTGHSGRIVGWSYAVKVGQRITAISAPRKALYPPSVFRKEPSKPVLDVQMLGGCAQFLLTDQHGKLRAGVPTEVTDFIRQCIHGSVPTGWAAYRGYDEILKKVYGKRAYRAFAMPR